MAKKPTTKKKTDQDHQSDADLPFKTVTQLTKDKAVAERPKLGRPTLYTKEMADHICEAIATSKDSLATICKPLNISVVSVFEWLDQHKDFAKNYARAREVQAEMMFDELREVAFDASGDVKEGEHGKYIDHENIQRSRLKVDTLKWAMSKLLPKRFGDKLDVTSGGNAMTFKIGYKKPGGDTGGAENDLDGGD